MPSGHKRKSSSASSNSSSAVSGTRGLFVCSGSGYPLGVFVAMSLFYPNPTYCARLHAALDVVLGRACDAGFKESEHPRWAPENAGMVSKGKGGVKPAAKGAKPASTGIVNRKTGKSIASEIHKVSKGGDGLRALQREVDDSAPSFGRGTRASTA